MEGEGKERGRKDKRKKGAAGKRGGREVEKWEEGVGEEVRD